MPRFDNVSCSQCGQDFGPGDEGFSYCINHRKPPVKYEDRLAVPVRTKLSTRQYERVYAYSQRHKISMAEVFRLGAMKLIDLEVRT